MQTIQLNGEQFPLAVTSEGEKFLRLMNVDVKAVQFGIKSEKLKYAYCMVAGAALKEKQEFPFTLMEFVKALPAGWEKMVDELREQFKVQSLKFKAQSSKFKEQKEKEMSGSETAPPRKKKKK